MKYPFFFVSVSVRLVLTPDFCSNPGVDFSIDRKSSLSADLGPGRSIIPVSQSRPRQEYLFPSADLGAGGNIFSRFGSHEGKASVGCFGTE